MDDVKGAGATRRGRIIQYGGDQGAGVVIADGQQYPFAIGVWRSETVPATGRTVEMTLTDGAISALTVVPDDVLLREKASEFGGKLSAFASRLSSQVSSQGSSQGASNAETHAPATGTPAAGAAGGGALPAIMVRYGKVLLIAYAAFLISTLWMNAISMSISEVGVHYGWSLFDLAEFAQRLGVQGGGLMKMLLVLAYLGVLLPIVWRDRRAWLGLAIPLIALLWGFFSLMHAVNSAGSFGDGLSNVISPGIVVAVLAALVLAAGGVQRYLRAA